MIKKFNDFILEMAVLSTKGKGGKKIFLGDKLLRDAKLEEVDDNMLLWYTPPGKGGLMPEGKFWLWLYDDDSARSKMNAGEYDILMFPHSRRFGFDGASTIDDVWKKSHQKHIKGAEHVLGIVEGFAKESEEIYIQMMSAKHKGNHVNTLMMDCLKDNFKTSNFIFEDPTDDGYAFIKKYAPAAEIKWTGGHRPKAWRAEHKEG